MRIIDRDIDIYQGTIENYERLRRNCIPQEENHYTMLIVQSQRVLVELKVLREVMNQLEERGE